MNVVGYLRVSTEGQADAFGLDVQRQTIFDYCAKHDLNLVAVFHDETSGTHGLEHRIGLAQALGMIPDPAETLLIPRLDRLARDLVMSEQLLREVWDAGGDVISCAEGEGNLRDDPNDPSRALIRQVLGAVAAYERSMIVLRMKRGRLAKKARGGYASGAPPYGYRADGHGNLVPEPAQQEGLAIIKAMHAEGASYRTIATELNRRGIPTKRGLVGSWFPSTVSACVNRKTPVDSSTDWRIV
jgi:DNA invertase Pin-like site-specific DNA recombinase